MTYAKIYFDDFKTSKEKTNQFNTKLIAAEYVTLRYIVRTKPSFYNKVKLSYARFPLISSIIHMLLLLSIISFSSYVILGTRPLHPILSLWLIVASGGLSMVVITAAGELDGQKT